MHHPSSFCSHIDALALGQTKNEENFNPEHISWGHTKREFEKDLISQFGLTSAEAYECVFTRWSSTRIVVNKSWAELEDAAQAIIR
jgi:hypothetical protein